MTQDRRINNRLPEVPLEEDWDDDASQQWKLVPVEPTVEQLRADPGFEASGCQKGAIYRAMVAASPSAAPAAGQAGLAKVEDLRPVFEQWAKSTEPRYHLGASKYQNGSTYQTERTQHAYEGFCAGYSLAAPVADTEQATELRKALEEILTAEGDEQEYEAMVKARALLDAAPLATPADAGAVPTERDPRVIELAAKHLSRYGHEYLANELREVLARLSTPSAPVTAVTREAFEAWMRTEGWENQLERYNVYDPDDTRSYKNRHTTDKWEGWEACAKFLGQSPAPVTAEPVTATDTCIVEQVKAMHAQIEAEQDLQIKCALLDVMDELRAAVGPKTAPDGWVGVAIVGGEHTSVAFRDEETARAVTVEGEPFPFWRSAPAPVRAEPAQSIDTPEFRALLMDYRAAPLPRMAQQAYESIITHIDARPSPAPSDRDAIRDQAHNAAIDAAASLVGACDKRATPHGIAVAVRQLKRAAQPKDTTDTTKEKA